jgi:hypothetical protein
MDLKDSLWSVAQVVECLSSKCKTLISNPIIKKKKKEKKRKRKVDGQVVTCVADLQKKNPKPAM